MTEGGKLLGKIKFSQAKIQLRLLVWPQIFLRTDIALAHFKFLGGKYKPPNSISPSRGSQFEYANGHEDKKNKLESISQTQYAHRPWTFLLPKECHDNLITAQVYPTYRYDISKSKGCGTVQWQIACLVTKLSCLRPPTGTGCFSKNNVIRLLPSFVFLTIHLALLICLYP